MKVKLPFEPSTPAQLAALEAMDDYKHLEKTIKSNLIGIKILKEEFDSINLKYIDSSANFITLIFNDFNKANSFIEFMLKNGIILRSLKGFGLDNCVRVSIGTMNEIKFFVRILKKYES